MTLSMPPANGSCSLELYTEAATITERLPSEDKSLPTSSRIRARVAVLERTALAATVFAAIQYANVRYTNRILHQMLITA